MTPTKDGAQVMMREFFTVLETDLNWDLSTYLPAIKHCYEQALTQPPVDVEALKREIYDHMHIRWPNSTLLNLSIIEQADFEMNLKVGVILDYLVSKGYLK